jgi:hypothetical protein
MPDTDGHGLEIDYTDGHGWERDYTDEHGLRQNSTDGKRIAGMKVDRDE